MAHGRISLTTTTTNSSAYSLRTAQEPLQAKVYLQRDKGSNDPKIYRSSSPANTAVIHSDRKPLEPPPVIEILLDDNDPHK